MKLPAKMRAMVLEKPGQPLVEKLVPLPSLTPGQVLVKVKACGVCRTDLHILDGELTKPKLPLIMGHEIVGTILEKGAEVTLLPEGATVGIPWLGYTCGHCHYCRNNQENLCDQAGFTGYTLDGGYAEYTVADERYCFPLLADAGPAAAPLLCAGLIGYRSFKMAGQNLKELGIYGFGAAAHILTQLAISLNIKVYAFTRSGDKVSQAFALKLGAEWAGDATEPCPARLDAAIIFAPVGQLVPKALADVRKGGTVVCGGIHMSDVPSFAYQLLWEERVLRSVANLTRQDGLAFLQLTSEIPIKTETQLFPLVKANEALAALRQGKLNGAAVLIIS